jgi:L-ascorbate metabolism protein UlaG (beta-lactamase superfamily)
VEELDWWQSIDVGGLQFVAAPAQHFSGRGFRDRDSTLWASWVILGGGLRLFFGGDSGYHEGFRIIGENYGPFDLTMLETGAYDRMWPDIHMQPDQTMQAHVDLRGKWLLPIHNGTFDLALHVWDDPLERIVELARVRQALVTTPKMGEALSLRQPMAGSPWWRTVRKKEA